MRIEKSVFAKMRHWAAGHYLQLALFNVVMIMLCLLRSAGYFDPYFLISVNFIVLMGLVMSVLLFGFDSRALFIVAFVFWVFAGGLRFLTMNVWADRTAIYVYQAIVLGVTLLVYESIFS
jgi:hypothetical protein